MEDATPQVQPRTPALNRLVLGAGLILVGLLLFLWVRNHSPHMGFGEMLANLNNYVINEPFYSLFIIISAGLGITGIIIIAVAFRVPAQISAAPSVAAAPSLADLRDGLKSTDPRHRERCASAIGDCGAGGIDALDDLHALSNDPDGHVRTRAQWAIENIGRSKRR